MQSVTHLEFAGLTIATDAGISGTGYTITVGHGGSVIQEALDSALHRRSYGQGSAQRPRDLAAALLRQVALDRARGRHDDGAVRHRHRALGHQRQGRGVAAVAAARRRAGRPTSRSTTRTPAGSTIPIEQLTDEALRLLDQGYTALKMKVGRADSHEDQPARGRRAQGDRRRRAADGRCQPEMGPDAGLPRGAAAGGIRPVLARGTAAPGRHPLASGPQREHLHPDRARRARLHDACVSRLHREPRRRPDPGRRLPHRRDHAVARSRGDGERIQHPRATRTAAT